LRPDFCSKLNTNSWIVGLVFDLFAFNRISRKCDPVIQIDQDISRTIRSSSFLSFEHSRRGNQYPLSAWLFQTLYARRRRPPLSTNLLAYSEAARRKRSLSWIYRNRRKLKSIFSFSEIFLRRAKMEAGTFVTFFFIQQLLSRTVRQFLRHDKPQRASLVCSDPDLDGEVFL